MLPVRADARTVRCAGSAAPSTERSLVRGGVKRFVRQAVPDDILHDAALNAAAAVLPSNYSFEVHKTVWRVRQVRAARCATKGWCSR